MINNVSDVESTPENKINKVKEKEITELKKTLLATLDNLPFFNFHVLVLISLGIFWILDGYEASLLAVLSGVLKSVFLMTDSEIGLSGSFYLVGCCIGSLFFGFLSAKYGRKFLFTITLLLYSFSITSTALAVNKYMFYVCRFFTGVSVGGEYSSIFAAVDELIPPSLRGRADIILDGTWHFGTTIAAIVAYISLENFKDSQEIVLRILFIVPVALTLPVIYLRRNVPESPRWLISKGNYTAAVQVVMKIQKNYSNCKKIIENSECDQELLLDNSIEKYKHIGNEKLNGLGMGQILKKLFCVNRSRFFYALILMASQAFLYQGVFMSYTLALQNFYNIPKESAGIYLIPLSAATFIGPILIGKYYDTWSRRKMIALTYCSSGILVILTSLNFLTDTFGFVYQNIFWFVTMLISSPAASSAHLTISEIFPVEMRSQAMAIFFSIGLGIGGVAAPFLFGSMIDNAKDRLNVFYVYIISASVMIAAGIFGFFYGVNAENKSLEKITEEIEKDDN